METLEAIVIAFRTRHSISWDVWDENISILGYRESPLSEPLRSAVVTGQTRGADPAETEVMRRLEVMVAGVAQVGESGHSDAIRLVWNLKFAVSPAFVSIRASVRRMRIVPAA